MVLPLAAVAARGAAAAGSQRGKSRLRRIAAIKARRAMRNVTKNVTFTGEKPSAMLYLGVAMIALLKDLLDFVGVGSLPGVGTVVTICFTFLIWILLTIFDHSGGKHNKKLARGFVVLMFGLVEAIGFGLNFLPIETAMVVVVYYMARKAWKKAEKEAEKERQENALAEMQAAQAEEQAIAEERQAEAQQRSLEAANDEEYQQAA
jgi:uncharacterized membrane protein